MWKAWAAEVMQGKTNETAYLIRQILPYLTLDERHDPTWCFGGAAVVLTTSLVSTNGKCTFSFHDGRNGLPCLAHVRHFSNSIVPCPLTSTHKVHITWWGMVEF